MLSVMGLAAWKLSPFIAQAMDCTRLESCCVAYPGVGVAVAVAVGVGVRVAVGVAVGVGVGVGLHASEMVTHCENSDVSTNLHFPALPALTMD